MIKFLGMPLISGLFTIIVIASFVSKCGHIPVNDHRKLPYKGRDLRQFKEINTDFIAIVDKFSKEFNVETKNLGAGYQYRHKDIVGLCYSYNNGLREIIINPYYEEILNSKARFEQLMYHELGHCLLNLSHNDSMIGSRPISIMRSYLFNTYEINKYYIPYRQDYIDELDIARTV